MKITPAQLPSGDTLIYEYGVRLDRDCLPAINDQITKARALYNELVACIRSVIGEMRAFVLSKAGPEAQACQTEIDALNAAFDAARAANDEDAMRTIAQSRREKWHELAVLLKSTRTECRDEIKTRFLSRIGLNSACETYQIRSKAVANGLGWATANAVLDAALTAHKKSFSRGNAPRFAVGADKDQDTLSLQFTGAGGLAATTVLAGHHGELAMVPTNGCGKRKYGEFRFRLGPASAKTYATGTWQYHRPIPDGAQIGRARLIRRKIGKDFRWAIQVQIKTAPATPDYLPDREPLVAVHFGWAADVSGRRVAGISDGPDPGQAHLIQLPPEVEERLQRAAEIQSARDTARDEMVPHLAEVPLAADPDVAAEELPTDTLEYRRAAAGSELTAIRRLPVQHVAIRRLHRLCALLREADALPDWLEEWRKTDRMRWQSTTHLARRARNMRRTFYRQLALDLARQYSAIAIEPLDLAAAAVKIDEVTGERTEFAKKARAGRVVAALSELESALRWAAVKNGTAVLEMSGNTASNCAYCGGRVAAAENNHQELHCEQCGASVERKTYGAAIAWQLANDQLEEVVTEFWADTLESRRAAADKQAEKKVKLAEGRRKARTTSGDETTEGSR
jgi:hypothetical protein